MRTPDFDFRATLDVLGRHDVEFVVVGGVAAVLHGVPMTTTDLDIVHRRTAQNVERLLAALDELEAGSRLDTRQLRPGPSHLLSEGHQLLTTRHGLLDVLGRIVGAYDFDDLTGDAVTVQVSGVPVRLISLEKLLETKLRAGRPKDLAAAVLIRQTLAEKRRKPPTDAPPEVSPREGSDD